MNSSSGGVVVVVAAAVVVVTCHNFRGADARSDQCSGNALPNSVS